MIIKNQVTQILNGITHWSASQPGVLALALVGSHARGTAKESSDIDLVLVTTEPEEFLDNTTWTLQFGAVKKQQIEYYGLVTSIRVWYDNGLEIEYGITDERWVTIPLDEGTRRVMADGMRILFEQGDVLSRHQKSK